MNDTQHNWPKDDAQHVWGPWMAKTGPPTYEQYRMCVHPTCKATETRTAPRS